jgi:hypothetical protein
VRAADRPASPADEAARRPDPVQAEGTEAGHGAARPALPELARPQGPCLAPMRRGHPSRQLSARPIALVVLREFDREAARRQVVPHSVEPAKVRNAQWQRCSSANRLAPRSLACAGSRLRPRCNQAAISARVGILEILVAYFNPVLVGMDDHARLCSIKQQFVRWLPACIVATSQLTIRPRTNATKTLQGLGRPALHWADQLQAGASRDEGGREHVKRCLMPCRSIGPRRASRPASLSDPAKTSGSCTTRAPSAASK